MTDLEAYQDDTRLALIQAKVGGRPRAVETLERWLDDTPSASELAYRRRTLTKWRKEHGFIPG